MEGNNITIKFRTVNRDIFQAIIAGEKKLETLAATPEYKKVKAGNTLTLICGNQKAEKKVGRVEHFQTIATLLKKYRPALINPKTDSVKVARAMWCSFPGYEEKIKKYGLVVWHLK